MLLQVGEWWVLTWMFTQSLLPSYTSLVSWTPPSSDDVNEMERANRLSRTPSWSAALVPTILCLHAKGYREPGLQVVAFPWRDFKIDDRAYAGDTDQSLAVNLQLHKFLKFHIWDTQRNNLICIFDFTLCNCALGLANSDSIPVSAANHL